VELYTAIQGYPFVPQYAVEIMSANACFLQFLYLANTCILHSGRNNGC